MADILAASEILLMVLQEFLSYRNGHSLSPIRNDHSFVLLWYPFLQCLSHVVPIGLCIYLSSPGCNVIKLCLHSLRLITLPHHKCVLSM